MKLIQILFLCTKNIFEKGNFQQKTALAMNLVLDVREKKHVIGSDRHLNFISDSRLSFYFY